jgi:hypothetical protein
VKAGETRVLHCDERVSGQRIIGLNAGGPQQCSIDEPLCRS